MKKKTRFALRYAIDYLLPMQENVDLTKLEMFHLKNALRELAAADVCEACMKRHRARLRDIPDDLPF